MNKQVNDSNIEYDGNTNHLKMQARTNCKNFKIKGIQDQK